MLKLFSTPDDPSRAITDAAHTIIGGKNVELRLLHGTTVGTNALLQRKGAKIAFVTTAGFEDTIEIGRQARPKLYDLLFEKVEPLVSAEMRFGITERTGPDGEILAAVKADDLVTLAQHISASHPQAIALSLLFAFANPANERAVADALKDIAPVSVSHQLLPEFREYERASTVTVNAYLQPLMQSYLRALQTSLGGHSKASSIFVMQSSGGITSLESAAREPVRTVLSGPAGGVVGASAMAQISGHERIISFDMGGTSTDVALVDGEIRATNEANVAGLPVRVPMLDIHTVGAGGGSIARFDAGGALRVGPESAGADPGPICYGKGDQPTVTDANLLLGRLRPDDFLGGQFRLDLERTRKVVQAWLREKKSSLSVEQFADGVLRVVNATMEKAVRVVSVERGYDSRDFTLVAFGGAGGLHACELASALGIPRVIVPAYPGALSAFGILVSDVVRDYSHTILKRIDPQPAKRAAVLPAVAVREISRELLCLRDQAQRAFASEGWRGKVNFDSSADVRYRGQGFELNIPFTPNLPALFAAEHERRYGYADDSCPIEIVTVRLRARLKSKLPVVHAEKKKESLKPGSARVWFNGKVIKTVIFNRESMPVGKWFSGPAVITEYSATTVVPAGARFSLSRQNSLLIERIAKK